MVLILALGVSVILFFIWRAWRTDALYPPGPKGVPILGSILNLLDNPVEKLQEYACQYGSYYTLKVGPVRCLILNDVTSIHGAFALRSGEFGARPPIMGQATGMGSIGIILLQSGPFHRHYKRKAVSLLKKAVGSDKFDDTIKPHIQRMTTLIGTSPRNIDLRALSTLAMSDIIGAIIFGDTYYQGSSETSQRIKTLISENFQNNPVLILAGKYLPIRVKKMLSKYVDMQSNLTKMQKLLNTLIKSLDYTEGKRADILNSFVSNYMEDYASSHDGATLYGNHEEELQLVGTIIDFFQAGSETTAICLHWLMLLLAENQDVQEKAQQEIDAVFGRDTPTLKEMPRLQYITAIIYEGMRIRPPAPLGAPHSTVQDINFHGYNIPKDTTVLANYFSAHHNPNDFQDPHLFKPERFLGEDGTIIKSKSMLSFGTGPRICAGEKLTKSIISSIIIHILHRYTLKSKDEKQVDLTFNSGINLVPRENEIAISSRKTINNF